MTLSAQLRKPTTTRLRGNAGTLWHLIPSFVKSLGGSLFGKKYGIPMKEERRKRRLRLISSMTDGLFKRGPQNQVAVVTGASCGLGRAIVGELCQRQLGRVYLTAPDALAGLQALSQLQNKGFTPKFHQLDVTDPSSVLRLADHLRKEYGGLDYLVNNAGVFDYENLYPAYEEAKRNIDVNYRSLLTIEEYLFPIIREHGRVVNISSACGHLCNLRNPEWIEKLQNPDLTVETVNRFVEDYLESVRRDEFDKRNFADDGKHAEHRVSKIALTALTSIWAKKYSNRHINVYALHPGHMTTAMSRGAGSVPPEYPAQLAAFLLLAAPPELSGQLVWHDRQIVDWRDANADLYYRHKDIIRDTITSDVTE